MKTKTPKTTLCIALAVTLGVSTPAFADRGHDYGRGYPSAPHFQQYGHYAPDYGRHRPYYGERYDRHRHGNGWVAPLAILTVVGLAAALSQPRWAPAPAPVAPAASNYWHYCASAGQYYPNVSHCPEGWQLVPAR